MPNPGGPYLGCETCRRRRIRCDRGRPGCVRCRKYGSTCPGYPLERDARFRHQTRKIVQKESATDSLAFNALNNRFSVICSNTTEQHIISFDATNSPTPNIMEDVVPRSVNMAEYVVLTEFFFNQSVMPVGWYSFLPKLQLHAPADGCLRPTLFATSCFLAANQLQDAEMARKARQRYGVALQAVNSAIADQLRSLQDDTLVSILLLNVLDDIAGQNSFGSFSHLEGCAQLIRCRQENSFQSELSADLAHSLVMQIQPTIIEGCRSEASCLREDLIGRWLYCQTRQSPAVEVLSFCFQISRLGKKVHEALVGDTDIAVLLIILLKDGMNLEGSMSKWCSFQDERWERRSSTSATSKGFPLDYYSDIQVAKTWNHWRLARIQLHTLLLDTISHLQVSGHEFQGNLDLLQSNSSIIIERMLSEISASIPYHLQQVDEKGRLTTQISQRALGGRALMWPLKMVIQCNRSTPLYKQEAVETLRFIGDDIGIKQAIVFLEETAQI